MSKRINKPVPSPYDGVFKSGEVKNEKEVKTIQTAEQRNCCNSAASIALALMLLLENNRQ